MEWDTSCDVRTADTAPRGLTRFLPILDWARSYDRRWLRGDLIAGIAVAALIVPKNLGYAGIAGIPVENGLYAAAAGALIYGVFGTSRQISTGPSSSLAAVAGGAVLLTGSGHRRGATWWRRSRSSPVPCSCWSRSSISAGSRVPLAGGRDRVPCGAAIEVVIGELPKLTGTSADG